MKNYYTVLGVRQTDSRETIQQAYRKLAKKYHPDLHPDDATVQSKFQNIGEAWETLGDPEKREKYDEILATGEKRKQPSGKTSKPAEGPLSYEDIMKGFGDFFGEDNIKKKSSSKEKSPIDTSDVFNSFMNFKKKP